MDGRMDMQTSAPGWCCGDKCPVVGQLGFSVTHQLEQALLLSLPSHPHHSKKDRQTKTFSWVSVIASECVVPSSIRFAHAMAVPFGPPSTQGKVLTPHLLCKPAPKTQQSISQGPFLPGPALCSASAFQSLLPPAAPGTLTRAASTAKEKKKGKKRNQNDSFYALGFCTLWPKEAFL